MLDWTNIAEGAIGGAIGTIASTAFLGVVAFGYHKATSRKKKRHKPKKHKKRRG